MFSKEEIKKIRSDYPYLDINPNGKKIVYLDNGATTQKPLPIIRGIQKYYENCNGNPHRGAHYLAVKSTDAYEIARDNVAHFIGAESSDEVIFVRNATEGINLVAYSWALNNLKEGDEILISIMEHHSNLVTWQMVAEKTKATLRYLYIDKDTKEIPWSEIEKKVSEKTKLFAITAASNVVGTMPDLGQIIPYVREKSSAVILVDGAQYIPHKKANVQELDCDFLVFSGHKMVSSMGIGVLYGKKDLLNSMEPFLYGGDMIEYVYEDQSSFLQAPQRFEAGTANVEGAISLSTAIDYLEELGFEKVDQYESYLTKYCYDKMVQLPYLEVYTTPNEHRSPVISFNFRETHPHDVASILDSYGIAVRSGHHCAQPLHRFLGCNFSCRASFSFYNTTEEIDFFVDHLEDVRRMMGLGS
ncbi:MAG: SufS family cysteine desulfurase [Tissierellia bacterium]|nr:SufS family cysteine desulfurase [Tissierellia bacterium]